VALTAGVTRGLAQDRTLGPSPSPSVGMWSLVPAVVLAIGLRLALQTFARGTIGWAALLLGSPRSPRWSSASRRRSGSPRPRADRCRLV